MQCLGLTVIQLNTVALFFPISAGGGSNVRGAGLHNLKSHTGLILNQILRFYSKYFSVLVN